MAVTDIHQLHDVFVDAFNRGDLDALVALYEDDATLVPQPGVVVSGHEAIRQSLTALFGLGGRLSVDNTTILESGNIALVRGSFYLKSGAQVLLTVNSIEVLRRHSNGEWLYVIDNPFPG